MSAGTLPTVEVTRFTQVTDAALSLPYSYGGQSYTVSTRKIRAGTDILSLDNMFPSLRPAGARANILLMPPDNRYTNVVQWSFDLQRALPFNTFVTLGYVGSKSNNLDSTIPGFNNANPSTEHRHQ